MKDKRLAIYLEDIVEDKVYRKLMDLHWEKLEDFKKEMELKIERDSKFIAKAVTAELMETIEKVNKKEDSHRD